MEWQVEEYRNKFNGRNQKKSEARDVGRNGRRMRSLSKLDCRDREVIKKVKGVKDFKQLACYISCMILSGGYFCADFISPCIPKRSIPYIRQTFMN
jgi:hypothetical protein